jgi:hypothetical protein
VAQKAGSIDISFNLISRGDVQGIPLVEMELANFVRPITTGITTNFLTARAAARHMIEQGSRVILALDSGPPGRGRGAQLALPGRHHRSSSRLLARADRAALADRHRPVPERRSGNFRRGR